MSREARITVKNKDCWYYIHAQTGRDVAKGALLKKGSGDILMGLLEVYTKASGCDIASVLISKNEYAIVLKMPKFQILSKEVLLERAKILYCNNYTPYVLWNAKKWKAFNNSLFSIASIFRSVHRMLVIWQTANIKTKQKFGWNDRFHSCVLLNENAVLDAMLYLESGPIREKSARDLISYPYSSFHLREKLKSNWILKVEGQLGLPKGAKGHDLYLQKLNHRANLPIKSSDIINDEIENGCAKGCNLERQTSYIYGIVMGTEKEVYPWLKKGLIGRDKAWKTKPTKVTVGKQYVLCGCYSRT